MELRDGRYERLRLLVADALRRSEGVYALAVKAYGPDHPVFCALEDSMEEWALLLSELDAAAPSHLKQELLPWPSALPLPAQPTGGHS